MINLAEDLGQNWQEQLALECPEQSATTRDSITRWLLGEDPERFKTFNPTQREIAQQAMEYRYRILRQRYLGVGRGRAYCNLTTRLGSVVLLRHKIHTWIALSRDRSRHVVDVLQEVVQELLQSDRYIQQQMAWIAKCTTHANLRNALLLTSIEEYCLRPIRHQPLIAYRFINYLRRNSCEGLTQVPAHESIRLISEKILTSDGDDLPSLLGHQALTQYQGSQGLEQEELRNIVKQKFSRYLAEHLGVTATRWFHLYLQGRSPKEIACRLNLEVKEVHRLREKINYHAVHVFALKEQPEIVSQWLETSWQEHGLGLTPKQWEQFQENLTQRQRQLLDLLKTGKSTEAIAPILNLKTHQVIREQNKFSLLAQALRSL